METLNFVQSEFSANDLRFRLITKLLDANVHLNGKEILDVGCGTGAYIGWFAEKGAKAVLGMDISPKSISLAFISFPGACLMSGDYMATSVGQKVDLIFSESAIHYFAQSFSEVLRKFSRDLNDEGEVFITHARWTLKSLLVVCLRRLIYGITRLVSKDFMLGLACIVFQKRYTKNFLEERLIYLKYCPRLLTRRSIDRALRIANYDPVRIGKISSSSFLQADHFYVYAKKNQGIHQTTQSGRE